MDLTTTVTKARLMDSSSAVALNAKIGQPPAKVPTSSLKSKSPQPQTSTSKKSASSSKAKRTSLSRRRILARDTVKFELLQEAHEPYVWAAYKRGVFDQFEDDLNQRAFDRKFWEYIDMIQRVGSELWAVMAKVKDHGTIPVGIVGGHFDGTTAFPHVDWFPEATSRVKIEAAVKFISDLKRSYMVMIIGPAGWIPFWRHLGQYGLLRQVGVVKDYYGKSQDAGFFQSVG